MWPVAVASAAALTVCGVWPASAEDTTSTGNRVFFRGGYAGLNSGRGGELFTDGHNAAGQNDGTGGFYIGAQFGAGFEYAVWKAFKVGIDARYHVTARMTNTNNDYFQVGPYVGISC